MQNSDAAITDDDDASATISDDGAATMDTDTDAGSKNDAVESLPPFLQGDKVLAYHSRRIYEAKVPLRFPIDRIIYKRLFYANFVVLIVLSLIVMCISCSVCLIVVI
ncbi:hypothetical protein HanLR1_Chr02g0046151 [Helianthus annuus]|nr:hypothetical protein HanLR1_Chr02g0046151 [Helianthus annuus]